MNATQQTEKLGKLVANMDGNCRGPRYGQVYTAPEGEKGFIAGYRNQASEGVGLMGRKWFATQKQAEDYAVQVSDF